MRNEVVFDCGSRIGEEQPPSVLFGKIPGNQIVVYISVFTLFAVNAAAVFQCLVPVDRIIGDFRCSAPAINGAAEILGIISYEDVADNGRGRVIRGDPAANA